MKQWVLASLLAAPWCVQAAVGSMQSVEDAVLQIRTEIPIVALHEHSPQTTLYQTPTPQWVAQISPPNCGCESGTDCDVLLINKQVHVDEEITYLHVVKKILTREGIHKHSLVELAFDPSFQIPSLHTLFIQRKGKRIDQVTALNMHLLPASQVDEDPARARRWALIALLDDVQEGDIIEYSYSAKGHNPCYLERTVDQCPFQHSFPVGRIFYRLTGRYPCQVHVKSHQMQIESVMQDLGQDQWEWVWNKVHIPGYTNEEGQPIWYQDAPWVQISEFADWAEVAQWGNKLFSLPQNLPQSLVNQIATWKSQHHTTEDLATAATRFVQDKIALVASDTNELHYPGDLDRIMRLGKADSVDKAYLLKTILHALGIRVNVAAVSASHRRAVTDWLASPTAFDRVILRLKLGDRWIWVDPTASCQGGPLGRGGCSSYQRALMFEADATQLIPIGSLAVQSTIRSKAIYYLWPDTLDTSLLIETTYSGEAADSLRRAVQINGEAYLLDRFKEAYVRIHGDVKASSEGAIIDQREADELLVREHYHIPNLWQITDHGRRKIANLQPIYAKAHLPLIDAAHRRTPVGLLYPLEIFETVQVIVPDRQWSEPSSDVHLQDSAVQVQVKRTSQKDTLTSQSNLRILSDHVRLEDMADYQELVAQIHEAMKVSISLPTQFDNGWDLTNLMFTVLYVSVAIGLLAVDPRK